MKHTTLRLTLVALLLIVMTALPVAAQKASITFATRDVRDVYPHIVEQFNATHPHIEVELLQVDTNGYGDRLITMFAGGVGPDAFFVFEGDLPRWIRMGLMENLDDFLAKDPDLNVAALYPATFAPMMYQGSVYGLSEYVNPNGLVWFNKTMFEEAGLEDPVDLERRGAWDMDVMRQSAQRLSREHADGTREAWGMHIANWWGPLLSFLKSNGFTLTDSAGNIAVNSGANLQAVEYLRQWTVEDRSTNAYEWPDEAALLRDKRLGMAIAGGWYTWVIDVIAPIEVDVVPMPVGITGSQAAVISNPAIGMNPNSPHKDAVWEFMRYILVGEGAEIRAVQESDLPSAMALANRVESPSETWQYAMSRSMEWAVPIPPAMTLREGAEGMLMYGDDSLEAVWRGNRPAGSILDDLQRRIAAIDPFDG